MMQRALLARHVDRPTDLHQADPHQVAPGDFDLDQTNRSLTVMAPRSGRVLMPVISTNRSVVLE